MIHTPCIYSSAMLAGYRTLQPVMEQMLLIQSAMVSLERVTLTIRSYMNHRFLVTATLCFYEA